MDRKVTLVFDIETDGLKATTIHTIAIYDSDTDKIHSYNDTGSGEPIVRGIQHLQDSSCIIGHNVIGYDLPVIRKLYGWFTHNDVIDTLLLSRLFHPDMLGLDKKHNWKHMPLQLYGRHSLESYGYRLGVYKGSFAKNTDWKDWSQEMEDYCIQDVKVTTKLCDHFHKYLTGSN